MYIKSIIDECVSAVSVSEYKWDSIESKLPKKEVNRNSWTRMHVVDEWVYI